MSSSQLATAPHPAEAASDPPKERLRASGDAGGGREADARLAWIEDRRRAAAHLLRAAKAAAAQPSEAQHALAALQLEKTAAEKELIAQLETSGQRQAEVTASL